MNENIAFLELKYGNIYGGYPNFYAISEIALLVFERGSNKIFLESWINQANVDIVDVYAETDELGHTVRRVREVLNMRSNRRFKYEEDFRLDDRDLQYAFKNLRSTKSAVRNFLLKNLRKYRFEDMIVFDGRRDIFLCERSGVNFEYTNIIDIQKDLNRETDYLFSLNKLAKVINFNTDRSYLRSNNQEYWLHPIAARQIIPGTAAFDAARLLMVYNEYTEFHDDFLIKAAILLNKIQKRKAEEKAAEEAQGGKAKEEE
ncbi:hypothetical protein [Lewinella sp. W8]|uniref:hypothetical protein n=1 Tax=Lewinella sp. W8 TaxID=2528208 RepID=UPI001068A860|nr:hypothetical protein [Lewinella sp. W8]